MGYFVPSSDLIEILGGYYPPGFGYVRWPSNEK